jgi:hypothetical protein
VEELGLLVVHVDMMCPILCEVVELLAVLIDFVVPLLQVEELLQLIAHESRR